MNHPDDPALLALMDQAAADLGHKLGVLTDTASKLLATKDPTVVTGIVGNLVSKLPAPALAGLLATAVVRLAEQPARDS